MEFSELLIYIRAKLNLSQTDLAKELKVSFATISRWENNKVNPTKKDIMILKQFCKDNNIQMEVK